MKSLNKVLLIGNLGSDPEMIQTKSGKTLVSLNLATNLSVPSGEDWQEITDWHRVKAWGKLAVICNKYLVKGRKIFVEGRLCRREWEKEDGKKDSITEIIANNIIFLNKGNGTGNYATATASAVGDLPM